MREFKNFGARDVRVCACRKRGQRHSMRIYAYV